MQSWLKAHGSVMQSGVTVLLQMLMSLLMNSGDTIMCEEFTYPHMIESFVIPKGFQVQGITTDDQGIVPEALSRVLEARSVQGQKAPRLLYTVPVGQNPTGAATLIDFGSQHRHTTHPGWIVITRQTHTQTIGYLEQGSCLHLNGQCFAITKPMPMRAPSI